MTQKSPQIKIISSPSKLVKALKETDLEVIGFHNRLGESNCFLNSALQILYDIRPFREQVRLFSNCPASKSHYCLSCGLKEIFTKYTQSIEMKRSDPIDISKLRSELATKYQSTGEFEINSPGDSIEALLALLNSFHQTCCISENSSNEKCSPKCPSHQVFELSVEESLSCQCGQQTTSLWDYSTFSHHFYVNEIFEDLEDLDFFAMLSVKETNQNKCISLSSIMKVDSRLQEYIKNQWESAVLEFCPVGCAYSQTKKVLRLLQNPKVFMVNLIWKDIRPDLLKILQVFASIPFSLSTDSIYTTNQAASYSIRSLILYGCGHYICAIQGRSSKLWFKVDDELCRKTGDGSWKELIFDCLRNRYYPVGIFYEESTEKEGNGISAKDWLKLERILLEYLKENHDTEDSPEWLCECGKKNSPLWSLCSSCNKIKPGLDGWACSKCTFINESKYRRCNSCNSSKEPETSEARWKCQCGKINSTTECECERKKTCTICNKSIIKRCNECFTGTQCKICKDYIARKDGKICYGCKGDIVGDRCEKCNIEFDLRTAVCRNCLSKLKHCRTCEKYSFPDARTCEHHHKVRESQPISLKIAKASENLSAQPCILCKKGKDTCICTKEKCIRCKKPILDNPIQVENFPVVFINRTSGQVNQELKGYLCNECHEMFDKCKLCKRFIIKGNECESVICKTRRLTIVDSSIPKQIPEDLSRSMRSNYQTISIGCQVCSRELSSAYGFCIDCKLKITSPKCKFCGSAKCTGFCENCIRNSQKCTRCGHRSHITHEKCINCTAKFN